MGQMIANLGVTGIIAVIVMGCSLVGMIICAKKQDVIAIAKPAAVGLMILVMVCAVVILMRTGVLGDQGTQQIIQNEFTYTKASYYMLGNHIANKLPGTKILLIVDRPRTNDTRTPLLLEAFKQGLAGKATITVTETPEIQWPADRPQPKPEEMDMIPLQEMMTAASFNTLMTKYADCNLVVSFIGLPNDIAEMTIWSIWQDGVVPEDKRPKMALINGAYHNLKDAIKSGIVSVVVAVNPTAKFTDEKAPADIKAAFDKRYILITPENVDQIAEQYQNMFEAAK
ncbi:MAG TPA: hypothetical protein DCZ94_00965 [Lentisphaeria bacterium]|nr:MAG: hypothetical protein A2X48_11805 [Lentisphaerae bacterium GWF2_49_21]HBC85501.1 hypothetical protein [Lentisphaeria bacterium]